MHANQTYHQFIKSYQCHGNVYLSNRRYFDCDFECGQTEDGDIIVRLLKFDLAFLPFIFNDDSVEFVSGHTSEGHYVRANITISGPAELSWDSNGGFSGNVEFYARALIFGNALTAPLTALTFHLVNFEFVCPLKWHLGGHDITVNQVERYEEAAKEMTATKRPKITAKLTITSPSHRIANEYEVERIMHDVCALLSLAKGCQIQWLYWDAYSLDDVLIKSYHWNGITTPYNNLHIILEKPPKDISDFVQQTFEHYRDVNGSGIWKFEEAIAHYADTLSRNSLLELQAINLVVLVDYLTQHYASSENMMHFIKASSFDAKWDKVQKLVACSLESHFSVEDLVKNKSVSTKKKSAIRGIVNDMANTIDELNRPSFSSLLKRLLKDLDLEVDAAEVKMFITIRNKLIHDSNFLKRQDFLEESLHEGPWLQFRRILSFTSRLMLAILQYRGYYYDWKLFKSAEWAGAQTGRLKMAYTTSNKQPL